MGHADRRIGCAGIEQRAAWDSKGTRVESRHGARGLGTDGGDGRSCVIGLQCKLIVLLGPTLIDRLLLAVNIVTLACIIS